jgi:hypothetical protein
VCEDGAFAYTLLILPGQEEAVRRIGELVSRSIRGPENFGKHTKRLRKSWGSPKSHRADLLLASVLSGVSEKTLVLSSWVNRGTSPLDAS